MKWNQCVYCGRFISLDDFENKKALTELVTEETLYSYEKFEAFHIEHEQRRTDEQR